MEHVYRGLKHIKRKASFPDIPVYMWKGPNLPSSSLLANGFKIVTSSVSCVSVPSFPSGNTNDALVPEGWRRSHNLLPCSSVCVTVAGSELCLSAGTEQSERHVILFPLLHWERRAFVCVCVCSCVFLPIFIFVELWGDIASADLLWLCFFGVCVCDCMWKREPQPRHGWPADRAEWAWWRGEGGECALFKGKNNSSGLCFVHETHSQWDL